MAELDSPTLNVEEITATAEAQDLLETTLAHFAAGDTEVQEAAAATSNMLDSELRLDAELDFNFGLAQCVALFSPDAAFVAPVVTSQDVPDYDGPEVDIDGLLNEILVNELGPSSEGAPS